jgi:hypothetical protein
LQEQLLRQLVAVVGLLQGPAEGQRIKSKPYLGGVAIDFVD